MESDRSTGWWVLGGLVVGILGVLAISIALLGGRGSGTAPEHSGDGGTGGTGGTVGSSPENQDEPVRMEAPVKEPEPVLPPAPDPAPELILYTDPLTPMADTFLTQAPDPAGLLLSLRDLARSAEVVPGPPDEESAAYSGNLRFQDLALTGYYVVDPEDGLFLVQLTSPKGHSINAQFGIRTIALNVWVDEDGRAENGTVMVRYAPNQARHLLRDTELESLRSEVEGTLAGYLVVSLGGAGQTSLNPIHLAIESRSTDYLVVPETDGTGQRGHPPVGLQDVEPWIELLRAAR